MPSVSDTSRASNRRVFEWYDTSFDPARFRDHILDLSTAVSLFPNRPLVLLARESSRKQRGNLRLRMSELRKAVAAYGRPVIGEVAVVSNGWDFGWIERAAQEYWVYQPIFLADSTPRLIRCVGFKKHGYARRVGASFRFLSRRTESPSRR